MKYCSKCGGQVEDDDIYCGFCGSKLKEDAPKEDNKGKQDFNEGSSASEDFDGAFDLNFDKDTEKEFDNEFGKNDGAAKSNSEFESYVEHGNPFQSSTTTTNNGAGSGHKPLLVNRFAKDAQTYGILALIFGLLGGILGIVFGIIGITKAKKALELCATGEYDGKPKATSGKTLSIVGIVLSAVLIIVYYIL